MDVDGDESNAPDVTEELIDASEHGMITCLQFAGGRAQLLLGSETGWAGVYQVKTGAPALLLHSLEIDYGHVLCAAARDNCSLLLSSWCEISFFKIVFSPLPPSLSLPPPSLSLARSSVWAIGGQDNTVHVYHEVSLAPASSKKQHRGKITAFMTAVMLSRLHLFTVEEDHQSKGDA